MNDINITGVEFTPELQTKLELLHDTILRWNQKMNLVSKEDESKIWERHIFDSLQSVSMFPKTWSTSLDIGCGMGFPLLPLAIAFPEKKFFGVEPRGKRIQILKQLIRILGIKNIELHHGMSEDIELPLKVDVMTCRAVGSLEEDWDRAQNHLLETGIFITFKTKVESLKNSTSIVQSKEYNTPNSDKPYYVVTVQKEANG